MKLRVLPQVWADIISYAKSTKDECSGMGKIVKTKFGYEVVSVHLVKQSNSGATTDIDSSDLGRVMYETHTEQGYLNLWWHSHCSMGAFWSSTDVATIKEMGNNGFIVALVVNHKEECRAAFFKKEDEHTPEIFIDDIPVVVENTEDRSNALAEELKAYIIPRQYSNKPHTKKIRSGIAKNHNITGLSVEEERLVMKEYYDWFPHATHSATSNDIRTFYYENYDYIQEFVLGTWTEKGDTYGTLDTPSELSV
jgi:hypothetical protein